MRLAIWLIILFSVLGCAEMPPLPKGHLCVMDSHQQLAVCVGIGSNDEHHLTFQHMNNYVAVSPQTWSEIQTYILKLKSIAESRCQ